MSGPVPGAVRSGEQCLSLSVEPDRGSGEGVNCGLISLHVKGRLMGKPFTVPRHWLTQGGTVSLGLEKPQMSSHLNYRK